MKNYPFIHCLEPRTIYNPTLKEYIMVPCNKCAACLNMKSSFNVMRIQAESQYSVHTRFITLTYSNEYIPRMHPIWTLCDDGVERYVFYDSDYGNFIAYGDDNLEAYKVLCRKCESYNVPFLRKYDLQLFFKRLRKYLDTHAKKNCYPSDKIRYFAVGEYGPLRLRPHYHIILWTQIDEIASVIGKAVSACWRYGRVSTEIPFGDVSNYVAKYVNGNNPLPSLLKLHETKPFQVHSLHLGENLFDTSFEKVYQASYRDIVESRFYSASHFKECNMWWTLKNYFFPRCKGYSALSESELFESYVILKKVLYLYPSYKEESIASLTERILRDISESYDLYESLEPCSRTIKFLADYAEIDWHYDKFEDTYQKAYRSLYSILRLSSHFLNNVCQGNDSFSNMRRKIHRIYEFWKEDELYNMNKLYKKIESDENDIFNSEEDYLLRFSLDPEKLSESKGYKLYRSYQTKVYNDSMKHKKLNDKNRILENY